MIELFADYMPIWNCFNTTLAHIQTAEIFLQVSTFSGDWQESFATVSTQFS